MRVSTLVTPVVDAIAGILYPPRCFLCFGPVDSPNDAVCPVCQAGLLRIGRSHSLRVEGGSRLRATGDIADFLALFLFEKRGPLQGALHLLKYSGMHSLGVWLGKELGMAVREDPGFASADFLIPVPLHPARLRERGYNQAGKICEGIAAITGLPVMTAALVRSRNTPSQTALGVHEREENVRGAFRFRPRYAGQVAGKSVVLVDDVMTTGATLIACAKALRNVGAGPVLAATVAVANRSA